MSIVTNEEREVIRSLWAAQLRLEDIRQDEDFFDLGGTSIAAVRMLARVGNLVGPMVDFTTFTRDPSLAGLVRAIGHQRSEG